MIILGSDQENKLLAKGGNYMELSIQIKKYRTELHLSQEELAEKDFQYFYACSEIYTNGKI